MIAALRAARWALAGLPRPSVGLGLFPAVTVVVFLGPILVGLVGTLLPSFGILPALGGTEPTLKPWRDLLAAPGLTASIRLTLITGVAATLMSVALAFGIAAAWHGSRWFAVLRGVLPPLLAVPHAAFAIGFAFLVAPSGWIVRLLSPWATGWTRPPDIALVQDPWGIAYTLALVCKEVPFLVLAIAAALGQTGADGLLRAARSLGYGPVAAWVKVVLPLVYRQVRLPVLAVLAYSLSAVEPALVLAPTLPPPLTPLVLRWFADPDLALRFQAAAGAVLQSGLVGGAILLWLGGERAVALIGRRWACAGGRGGSGWGLRAVTAAGMALAVLAVAGSIAVLALWALARGWRFADPLPAGWTLDTLAAAWPGLAGPALNTLLIGAAAVGVGLVLVAGCLENGRRLPAALAGRALWLVYLPLLVPSVGFLFGIQVVLVAAGLDGRWPALVWAHLLYVLPYMFLALADPWRALDERYERSARALGAGPWRSFLRVRVPLLLRPLATAAAIGFSVSVAQYLPTLFAGSGRVATLTTEAVVLASGADRRVTAVYAFAQALLPLLAFAAAVGVPAWMHRRRRGMRTG
ncbi:ABC transporter permease [Azospirillum oleiclasticum]|uniref:ABC transporter permease n=1 Tax=Azospirillum oleiclasticum TaxID=2735135 RepID=UPI0031B5BF78